MNPIIFPFILGRGEGGRRADLRDSRRPVELHADSHYLRRRGEEGFLPVITWTRERLFSTGEIIALYTRTLSSYCYSLDLAEYKYGSTTIGLFKGNRHSRLV